MVQRVTIHPEPCLDGLPTPPVRGALRASTPSHVEHRTSSAEAHRAVAVPDEGDE